MPNLLDVIEAALMEAKEELGIAPIGISARTPPFIPTSTPTSRFPIGTARTPLGGERSSTAPTFPQSSVNSPTQSGSDLADDPEFAAILDAIRARAGQPEEKPSLLKSLLEAIPGAVQVGISRDPSKTLGDQLETREKRKEAKRQRAEAFKDLELTEALELYKERRRGKQEGEKQKGIRETQQENQRLILERQDIARRIKAIDDQNEADRQDQQNKEKSVNDNTNKDVARGVPYDLAKSFHSYRVLGIDPPKEVIAAYEKASGASATQIQERREQLIKKGKGGTVTGKAKTAQTGLSSKDQNKLKDFYTKRRYFRLTDPKTNASQIVDSADVYKIAGNPQFSKLKVDPLNTEENITEGLRRANIAIQAKQPKSEITETETKTETKAKTDQPSFYDPTTGTMTGKSKQTQPNKATEPDSETVKKYAQRFKISEEQARKELMGK